jgi:hypothetical protein
VIDYKQPHLATYQSPWEAMGYNHNLPDWYRLQAFAIARCAPNLHAEFASGQLSILLGKEVGGTFQPVKAPRLSNIIAQAKERKLLDEASHARCLILPSHMWGCGLIGNAKPCNTCHGKQSKPRRFHGTKRRLEKNLERPTEVLAGERVLTSLSR